MADLPNIWHAYHTKSGVLEIKEGPAPRWMRRGPDGFVTASTRVHPSELSKFTAIAEQSGRTVYAALSQYISYCIKEGHL